MASSICLIVTGAALIDSVHEVSQGAGQTRPVTSGRLLVISRRRSASRHSPLQTRSFHSGIRFTTGQPIGVAPGDAAVHAAGALVAQLRLGERLGELRPAGQPLPDGEVLSVLPREIQEAGHAAHQW